MIHVKNVLDRVTPLGAAATLLLSVAVPALAFHQASAAALTNRSLMVSTTVARDDVARPDGGTYTGLAPGDPRNGVQVSHTYKFTVTSGDDLEAFTIEYCEKAFDFVGANACAVTPTTGLLGAGTDGFSASAWNGGTVTASVSGGGTQTFGVVADAANHLTLTTTSGALAVNPSQEVTIEFPADATYSFANPKANYKAISNGTYFAHIKTFADDTLVAAATASNDDIPAGVIDNGTVTNNITTAIGIYTRVQETLNFSVEGDPDSQRNGAPVAPTPTGVGCDPLTRDGLLHMGDLNSALVPDQANKVSSYFRLSTNASNGTNVYYSGDTLANSNHSFASNLPVASGTSQTDGVEAFGIGLETTAYPLTDLTAAVGYDNAVGDAFSYDPTSVSDPKVIASATNQTVACDTGRVDYMASTAPDTPAGIYQTKINYIASPRY